MVSPLWKACSEGHLENVLDLLKDASSVDIEIKDHTGVTPLIEAIKNGHVAVARALLDKGADPSNCSSHARPEQYTTDPTVLEALSLAQSKMAPSGMSSHENGHPQNVTGDTDKAYYGPPPAAYTYYPTLNSPPPLPEATACCPPQQPQPSGASSSPGGPGNLPPPEVAKLIPCRYFPACRYGSSCLFAHPQGPYFPGPLPPPAQYPTHFDPMAQQPYTPNYYAVSPPSFEPPTSVNHMTSLSPPLGHPIVNGRSGSDIVPSTQTHFTPNGAPPPVPYGIMSPMSPTTYSHPGQVPVTMSIPTPPLLHHTPPAPPSGSQPSHSMYNTSSPPALFAVRQDVAGPYSPQNNNASGGHPDVNGDPKSPTPRAQPDAYGRPTHKDGMNHNRRGSNRRGSFGGRKPPCLFYPAGKCKNGDDCRFPHMIPDGPVAHHNYPSGRGGGPRPRGHSNGNVFGNIDQKLAGMSIRDDALSRTQNGADSPSLSHSTDRNRPQPSQSIKVNHAVSGVRPDKRSLVKQRVPNADEFPVLAGSTTPPSRSPGLNGSLPHINGQSGPTAAQVLQAPPPIRKDSAKESSTRGATPEPSKVAGPVKESKAETKGILVDSTHDHTVNKLPVSFASVATIAPDMGKEVSVSA